MNGKKDRWNIEVINRPILLPPFPSRLGGSEAAMSRTALFVRCAVSGTELPQALCDASRSGRCRGLCTAL